MKFTATLQLNGKTATGIEVPESVVTALNSGKRPAVSVTINGFTYRSTVAPMGGAFMLPVSAEVRGASGMSAGDVVDVEVSLDTAPRTVEVPDDFAEALAGMPEAKAFFEGLAYSHQRRHVMVIEEAKTPETRARRIAKAVQMLREGTK